MHATAKTAQIRLVRSSPDHGVLTFNNPPLGPMCPEVCSGDPGDHDHRRD